MTGTERMHLEDQITYLLVLLEDPSFNYPRHQQRINEEINRLEEELNYL